MRRAPQLATRTDRRTVCIAAARRRCSAGREHAIGGPWNTGDQPLVLRQTCKRPHLS